MSAKSRKPQDGSRTIGDGPTRRVLLLFAGVTLAACGSAGASATAKASTTSAPEATAAPTTTGAPKVPPGFKNGAWVGTGSAIDQQLVYIAKMAVVAASLIPDSTGKYSAQQLSEFGTYYISADIAPFESSTEQMYSQGMVIVSGANVADPSGAMPAWFSIQQQPTTNTSLGTQTASVVLCLVDTAHAEYKATGKPVSGLVGYAGPARLTVSEELTPQGWKVLGEMAQEVTSCPAGNSAASA